LKNNLSPNAGHTTVHIQARPYPVFTVTDIIYQIFDVRSVITVITRVYACYD